MPREFRLTTTVELPEGVFAEAAILGRLEVAVTAFQEAIVEIAPAAVVEFDVVTPKPRGEKAAPVPEPAPMLPGRRLHHAPASDAA